MTDTKQVVGAAALNRRLRRIREGVNATLLNDREITEFLVDRNRRRFREGVDPDGIRWTPLKKGTLRRKKWDGVAQANRPLYRTGLLYRSIGVLSRKRGEFGIAAVGTYRLGVRDPKAAAYGAYHQFGIGVPQRRFLGISALDIKAVDSMLRRAIIRIAN